MKLKAIWTAIAVYLGMKENEILTEEHVEKLNSELDQRASAITSLTEKVTGLETSVKDEQTKSADLQTKLTAAEKDLGEAKAKITTLEAEKADLQAKNDKLSGKPAADPAVAVTDKAGVQTHEAAPICKGEDIMADIQSLRTEYGLDKKNSGL